MRKPQREAWKTVGLAQPPVGAGADSLALSQQQQDATPCSSLWACPPQKRENCPVHKIGQNYLHPPPWLFPLFPRTLVRDAWSEQCGTPGPARKRCHSTSLATGRSFRLPGLSACAQKRDASGSNLGDNIHVCHVRICPPMGHPCTVLG